MTTRNELLVKQNYHMQKLNEFNNTVFQMQSGMQMPENTKDEAAMKEFQEHQTREREAVGDLYHSDLALGGMDD